MMDDTTIRLDRFLKLIGAARTGGAAKWLVLDGKVAVNGVVEERRSRKLRLGDTVTCAADGDADAGRWIVSEATLSDDPEPGADEEGRA
jgi:ribosome-associated protein